MQSRVKWSDHGRSVPAVVAPREIGVAPRGRTRDLMRYVGELVPIVAHVSIVGAYCFSESPKVQAIACRGVRMSGGTRSV